MITGRYISTPLLGNNLRHYDDREDTTQWTQCVQELYQGAVIARFASGLLRIGRSPSVVWRLTQDPRSLYTSNRFLGCSIPDYFRAKQR